ncbi:hypothetical protein AUR64_07435 [Haloprofundus marisrubri]|uniref:DUF8070 domain-containing protein n=1 Tax=Haloprofundus marisrubri TaxID=1514971 RepID=A0A0W1RBC9_9EURY|nr:hypothetical protein [Haloprofundus marisrubri]KTG10990.1 hypothetical protein AUR64_07435 [Haloprofundus marisrubri]
MNWSLLLGGTVRYTLLYGGSSVAVVALVTRSQIAALLLAATGGALVLFALGRNSGTNYAVVASNADSAGFAGTVMDPGKAGFGGSMRLFFYGLGLLVFGAVALVALAVFL